MTGRMLALCIGAIGGAVLLLSSTTATAMALVAFGIVGVCSAFINVLVITVVQTVVRPELRGRVMALVVAVSTAATPLGMAIGGLMGDLWGHSLRQVFAACGMAMMLVALHAARLTCLARALTGGTASARVRSVSAARPDHAT
jgi:MFS family permease